MMVPIYLVLLALFAVAMARICQASGRGGYKEELWGVTGLCLFFASILVAIL